MFRKNMLHLSCVETTLKYSAYSESEPSNSLFNMKHHLKSITEGNISEY